MNRCCRCNKRIWPWQKEGNSPIRGTNDNTYFHLTTCTTLGERFCLQLYWLIPVSIVACMVGGLVAAHFIWFLPKG